MAPIIFLNIKEVFILTNNVDISVSLLSGKLIQMA